LLFLILTFVTTDLFAQNYSKEQIDYKFTPSYPILDIYQQGARDVHGRKQVTFFNDFVESMRMGGDFRLTFQDLSSANTASGTDSNVNAGFTNSRGNWFWDVELTKGFSTFMEVYLYSEHHLQLVMRQGYAYINKLPGYNSKFLDDLFEVFSLKAGQMEINFGDWHLRRTENGTAQKNPLIGNHLIDSNTSEIGLEAHIDKGDIHGLAAFTGGTTKEDLSLDNGFGWYAKLAWDKKGEDNRFRLAASYYGTNHQNGTSVSYLYSGNRGGSPYRGIHPGNSGNAGTTDAGQILPNITSKVEAWEFDILFQMKSLEVFGTYEIAKDRNALTCSGVNCIAGGWNGSKGTQANSFNQFSGNPEKWDQWALDLVYRFDELFHIAARYNEAHRKSSYNPTVSPASAHAHMFLIGLGYYLKNTTALFKLEYMTQKFYDFNSKDYYFPYARYGNNSKADGVTLEGSVTF
jgi:hypothetical protein